MEDSGSIIILVIYGAFIIFMFAALWQLFSKAGQPGFLAIIPIVNLFILVQIAGKDWWWIILLFIPLVNIVAMFLIWQGVAENFGKGTGYAIGLFFLSPIFIPLLAFGDATYRGRKSKAF
ncbi:MAG: DUF5684 domain-containing protein [Chloroflexota bacterium]